VTTEGAPLARRLPPVESADADAILNGFLAYVAEQKLELYPAQEEALLEVVSGKNVILNTPTGSGKSLVATAMHFASMARGKRSFYTCPIKALVSEKFFALCEDFGPDNVGMMTGDASVNRDAPIICCTAEILANMALREGADADVDFVVMDEFHYYADRDRGVAWQIPLLTLRNATFLLMSATLGNTEPFEKYLNELTGRPTAVIRSTDRPVPLDFEYRETPLHETVADLIEKGKSPIYVVNFTQRACAEEAQNLMSTDFCTKDEKKAILAAISGIRFDSPYGKEVQKFIKHGIGIHHAGLLPKYRLVIEKLAQRGHLKIICGTDTLGVGVNIPIRTVLFTKLCKFDGEKTGILSVRDFHQISGRAGRKGFDHQGSVVAQAPEHAIENLRLDAKAGSDPGKKRRLVRKKPPDKGYVHWDRATFVRLTTSPPEPLQSRFQITHGMLLNVLERPGGGCKAIAHLIRDSHERRPEKRIHGKMAMMMLRSLIDAGIIELGEGKRLTVNQDLQVDFSLNQTLSLYLHETIPLLDPESPTHALDLLTLVESILENPELVLMKQLDRLKTLKMAEMKAAGVEYDERIAELDKMEYPKPNKEFIYLSFNAFAAKHPWVGAANIRPKSVAREMYETFQSFAEYVREYELQRAEGLLLRFLSDVYKVLVQTVPERAKTEEVNAIITYFGAIVRQVDSSLLDEWERMRDPSRANEAMPRAGVGAGVEAIAEPAGSQDITRDEGAFTVLVRNEMFRLMRALSRRDYATAAEIVEPSDGADEGRWTAKRLEDAFRPYFDEHASLRVDPPARSPALTKIEKRETTWEVEQILLDPEEANDWLLVGTVDLARAREAGRPLLHLRRLGT
jgi:superfamily II RNA helicase